MLPDMAGHRFPVLYHGSSKVATGSGESSRVKGLLFRQKKCASTLDASGRSGARIEKRGVARPAHRPLIATDFEKNPARRRGNRTGGVTIMAEDPLFQSGNDEYR